MRFSICNETFQGWDWERTCAFVAECGYGGVEVAPFTLAADVRELEPARRRHIREVAEVHGLQVCALHWLLVSPEGLSLTTPDPVVRTATSAYLVALADLAGDLGAGIMVLGSPRQRWIAEGDDPRAARSRFIEALRPALDHAERREVRICLEPLPPPEANFLLTLDEAEGLLRELRHPAACTIFDVKSASAEGQPLDALLLTHIANVGHIHANDANRRGPGFGATDFRPILRAAQDCGYDGWVSVEVFDYSPSPEAIATESLRYLTSCL